ncbi:Mo-dependent nitrogenase family protein [Tolypothrix tenuis PCC 7101]|uniref:Mo-dependent nitrogenase family protein n=1 Tax=Tolypothrix tenuis PCC 7101 TaxID=231146 RepID=A0A1Z4N9Q9_9CYAN|nr:Mo-dependent nitrogenase C-terminal domain-containing protein [Aulosira sp. FACHB-113]BAZ02459.1 Mo-dependent nitrogenase family protein [Tolypothrix tenuis PCC 7101]BAZ73620.1 Mo-dependent nitrogenase family protein [Aulosira laxa NIES-50]
MIKTANQPIVFSAFISPLSEKDNPKFDLLQPLRQWLDNLEIHNQKVAKFIAKLIPAQCPFERDIMLFGRKIAHIPPMCKLNPLYDQFVGLRFRALCYLVDKCGEDIQSYC